MLHAHGRDVAASRCRSRSWTSSGRARCSPVLGAQSIDFGVHRLEAYGLIGPRCPMAGLGEGLEAGHDFRAHLFKLPVHDERVQEAVDRVSRGVVGFEGDVRLFGVLGFEADGEAVVVEHHPHPEGFVVDDVGDACHGGELDAAFDHATGLAGERCVAVPDLADCFAFARAFGDFVDGRHPLGEQPGVGYVRALRTDPAEGDGRHPRGCSAARRDADPPRAAARRPSAAGCPRLVDPPLARPDSARGKPRSRRHPRDPGTRRTPGVASPLPRTTRLTCRFACSSPDSSELRGCGLSRPKTSPQRAAATHFERGANGPGAEDVTRRTVVGAAGAQPFAYSSAVRESNSNPTTASSPTTHASCPGSITYAWPARISCSVPSSWTTCIVPDCSRPTWWAWQRSPPTIGLTHSDHLQPGSNRMRDAFALPMRTTSIVVLSGARVSSGEPKSPTSTPAI